MAIQGEMNIWTLIFPYIEAAAKLQKTNEVHYVITMSLYISIKFYDVFTDMGFFLVPASKVRVSIP